MKEKCPTCGASVKVVGKTTMHYEPIGEEIIKSLEEENRRLTRVLTETKYAVERALLFHPEMPNKEWFDNVISDAEEALASFKSKEKDGKDE